MDFWRSCGFRLLEKDDDGRLVITDDFLRAYFQRPELAPIAESCAAERALHQTLLDDPCAAIDDQRIAALADVDAGENYRVMLRFRERLLAAPSLEACYSRMFQDRDVSLPPLFIDQLVQVILRNILNDCENGLVARAAELFYRQQRVNLNQGGVMLADATTVALHESGSGLGSIGKLIIEAQMPLKSMALNVLDENNQGLYWMRDERYDTVFALHSTAARDAFCRVIETWIAHFHQTPVKVSAVREIAQNEWLWHVGLDAEATGILNDLYNGLDVPEDRLARILALFRVDFLESAHMRAELAGRPVFLGLAMTTDNIVRMKPQNLLANLPLARRI
ncbi:MAG: DUF6352 family protein [Burkholderiales bacterium]